MPRPLREEVEDGIYHVFSRGNRRAPIFLDEADYALYLAMLGGVVVAKRWRLLAYCLMPNHVHLVLETPETNLARGMQHLHGLYARQFNDRYEQSGHLFQGRYGSNPIKDDIQLLAAIRYVAANPVDADLCAEPQDWEWNSFGPVMAATAPVWLDSARLLDHLALWGGDPLRGYATLVNGGPLGPG